MLFRGIHLPQLLFILLLAGCSGINRSTINFATGPSLRPADLPQYVSGEFFRFDQGKTKTITSVNEETITWKDENGVFTRSNRDFILPISTREGKNQGKIISTVSGVSGNLWPLLPGNTTRFWSTLKNSATPGMIDNYVERWNSCSVEGTAQVKVPAGVFNTHVITCQSNSTIDHTWRESRRYYYSADIGYYIQLVKRAHAQDDAVEKLVQYGFSQDYLEGEDQKSLHATLLRALNELEDGQTVQWQSKLRKVTADLMPTQSYIGSNGYHCRQFSSTFKVNGRQSRNLGKMCKADENVWQ